MSVESQNQHQQNCCLLWTPEFCKQLLFNGGNLETACYLQQISLAETICRNAANLSIEKQEMEKYLETGTEIVDFQKVFKEKMLFHIILEIMD